MLDWIKDIQKLRHDAVTSFTDYDKVPQINYQHCLISFSLIRNVRACLFYRRPCRRNLKKRTKKDK